MSSDDQFSDKLRQAIKRREEEFIVYENVRVYCATWNVNGTACYENSPLELWLGACSEPADIYAIGLQEVDMSTASVILRRDFPDPKWNNKLLKSLHRNGDYQQWRSVRLVGMMLTLFVRKEMRHQIRRCVTKTLSRGIMNTLGNKGAVAVSIKLNRGSMCFVNCHLAAHTEMLETRNDDYLAIEKGIEFAGALKRIADHDHIFWLGDLNYRIEDAKTSVKYRFPRPSRYDYVQLMPYDQLRREMRKGNCFQGYREGDIKFKPTYKYDVGTDNFDSSEKQRAPAYCDRVLWKGARIEQLAYMSVMAVRQSDHKPVYAIFNVKVKTEDPAKYEVVRDEVFNFVVVRDEEIQPRLLLEKSSIDFGEVYFNEMAVQDFIVRNNCHVSVYFMFNVKSPPLNDICEKWLSVQPHAVILLPGQIIKIKVRVMIDENSVRNLLHKTCTTNGKFDLDILVLHVQCGSDTFIPIMGEYKPSCFGLSMETLCRSVQPIFDCTQADVKELMCSESEQFAHEIPQEFLMLYNYLKGKTIEGSLSNLHSKQYVPEQLNEIRDWLDCRSKKQFPGSPNAAAKALLMLLDLPAEPLLHPYVDELLHTNDITKSISIISKLPVPRKNIFWKLCLLLGAGIEGHYLEINDVADTFGSVLLRSCTPQGDSPNLGTLRRKFMYRFLQIDTDRKQSGCKLS